MHFLKLYFKIVRTQWRTVLIYGVIFIGVFMAFGYFSSKSGSSTGFQAVKADIAIIDNDQSELSSSFVSYLTTRANVVEVGEKDADIKDALFYGWISYAIEIPEHFEEDFLAGKEHLLNSQSRPDNVNANMVAMYIESYLKNITIYHNAHSELSMEAIHTRVMDVMDQELTIDLQTKEADSLKIGLRTSFYNYLSYLMMVLIIMIVGISMTTIFKANIQKRNLVSPVSNAKMNVQLFMSNLLLAIGFWTVFTVVILILSSENMFSFTGLLYIINSFIFALVCVAIAFLISCILMNKRHINDVLNGITNVFGLGSSFLCGAFVHQQFISEDILRFSSFLPTFWYVKVNETLATVSITSSQVQEVMKYMGIEILFSIAFLLLALMITKSKRSQDTLISSNEQR